MPARAPREEGHREEAPRARTWQESLPTRTVEVTAGEVVEIHEYTLGTVLCFDDDDALRVAFCDGRTLTIPRHGDALEFDGRTGKQILSTGGGA